MELRQLKYFTALADTLNFSRAAESLYISQSALSRQIAELEQELGTALFLRDSRNVSLTQAGRLLLPEAKSMLIQADKLAPLLRRASAGGQRGRLFHIGVEPWARMSATVHRELAEAVSERRRASPGLSVLFWSRDAQELKNELLSGGMDMGIFLQAGEELDEGLDTLTLLRDRAVLVLRQGRRQLAAADIPHILERRGVVVLEKEPRALAQTLRIFDALNSTPQLRFCADIAAMLLTVESGESTAILPESVARSLPGGGLLLLPFDCPPAQLSLVAAWKRGEPGLAAQIARDCRGRTDAARGASQGGGTEIFV